MEEPIEGLIAMLITIILTAEEERLFLAQIANYERNTGKKVTSLNDAAHTFFHVGLWHNVRHDPQAPPEGYSVPGGSRTESGEVI